MEIIIYQYRGEQTKIFVVILNAHLTTTTKQQQQRKKKQKKTAKSNKENNIEGI